MRAHARKGEAVITVTLSVNLGVWLIGSLGHISEGRGSHAVFTGLMATANIIALTMMGG